MPSQPGLPGMELWESENCVSPRASLRCVVLPHEGFPSVRPTQPYPPASTAEWRHTNTMKQSEQIPWCQGTRGACLPHLPGTRTILTAAESLTFLGCVALGRYVALSPSFPRPPQSPTPSHQGVGRCPGSSTEPLPGQDMLDCRARSFVILLLGLHRVPLTLTEMNGAVPC